MSITHTLAPHRQRLTKEMCVVCPLSSYPAAVACCVDCEALTTCLWYHLEL